MAFTQRLAGSGRGKYRYSGLLGKLSGYKVGRGVIMIPLENMNLLTDYLDEKGVDYVVRYVWA